MSINWVMLNQKGDIEPLPSESIFHKTRGRVSLHLSAPSPGPGVPAYSQKCDRGTAYITTQRVIYLPAAPTGDFKSFSGKILALENGHPGAPLFFGASFWEADFRPVSNGNIPSAYSRVSVKLTFNDGGHYDWTVKFEEMKGRLAHAAEIARETGQSDVLNRVNGEQLPEYTPGEGGVVHTQTNAARAEVEERAEEAVRERQVNQPLPDEPPPGYEEAQAQAIGTLPSNLNSSTDER